MIAYKQIVILIALVFFFFINSCESTRLKKQFINGRGFYDLRLSVRIIKF